MVFNRTASSIRLAFAAIFALALSGCVTATKHLPATSAATANDVDDDPATQFLLGAIYWKRPYAVMPGGSSGWLYFGAPTTFGQTPPSCTVQVLSVGETHNLPRDFALTRWFRFPQANDGSNVIFLAPELQKQCDSSDFDKGWFNVTGTDPEGAVFAAWSASGALHAIYSGRNFYAGIDLTKYANQPASPELPGLTIRGMSKFADDIDSVRIVKADRDSTTQAVLFGFEMMGACSLEVHVTFETVLRRTPTGVDRKITSIEMQNLACYVI